MLKTILIVGAGGFIGSIARYLAQVYVEKIFHTTFPLGTFVANLLGCFIIGIVFAIAEKGNLMSPEWRIFLTVGFCGGFTTFSSFAYNNFSFLKEQTFVPLFMNIGLSVVVGILAVYLGILLVRSVL
ncbi:MAG: fluoride efflux transporter CrcB [Prolixibacteraceae bacterium]|jgi:CrcB protein|nr:fluoride efflux transporter CrcB [Prolixibacteraceae bacterium]